MTTKIDWPGELMGALEKQHEQVMQLDRLAATQRDLIEADRTDALLGLLQRRQTLIDGFLAGQKRMEELTEDLEARLGAVDDDTANTIRSLIESISERLGAVMAQDSSDQEVLEKRRGKTRESILELDKGAAARSAYLKRLGMTNRYADRHG